MVESFCPLIFAFHLPHGQSFGQPLIWCIHFSSKKTNFNWTTTNSDYEQFSIIYPLTIQVTVMCHGFLLELHDLHNILILFLASHIFIIG